MDERKFSTCALAVDGLLLHIASLKNPRIKKLLLQVKMKEEDLTEDKIASDLDDLYEFCVLREPDDPETPVLKGLLDSLKTELPNYERYKEKYNW